METLFEQKALKNLWSEITRWIRNITTSKKQNVKRVSGCEAGAYDKGTDGKDKYSTFLLAIYKVKTVMSNWLRLIV